MLRSARGRGVARPAVSSKISVVLPAGKVYYMYKYMDRLPKEARRRIGNKGGAAVDRKQGHFWGKFNKKILAMCTASAMACAFIVSGVIMLVIGGKQKTVNAAGEEEHPGEEVVLGDYYRMFGYNWLCVAKDPLTHVATFWMDAPMAVARWEDDDTDNDYFNRSTYIHGVLNGQYVSGDVADTSNPLYGDGGTPGTGDGAMGMSDTSYTSYDASVANSVLQQLANYESSLDDNLKLLPIIVPGHQVTNDSTRLTTYDIGSFVPSDAKIWLPSVSEVGTGNGTDGFWKLTTAQRRAVSSYVNNDRLIGMAPANSTMTSHSWLRSPSSAYTNHA